MFPYTLQQLQDIFKAQLFGNSRQLIEQIWIDSRNIVEGKNGIFFALKGAQLDGHRFVEAAYEKGIRNFVVTHLPEVSMNANFLVVENTLVALQQWASFHRALFHYPVIGITGSNGKTIVKEWLYQLLYKKIKLIRSPKSYNSQIGVPLSILEMMPEIDLSIIELGISQPGEMEKIARIVRPDIALITNVGEAHAHFFENRSQHIKEKLKIAKESNIIIYPKDDADIERWITTEYSDKKLISFGISELAQVRLLEISNGELQLEVNSKKIHFPFQYSDRAAISNLLSCVAVLTALNWDISEFFHEISNLIPVEMRLEIKDGDENMVIINDSFNSDLSSIPIALNVLNQQTKPLKTLVITDVLQNRLHGEQLYTEVANWVNAYDIQKVYLIGEEIVNYKNKFKNFNASFPATQDFLERFSASDFVGEALLLKGARKFELEKISKKFESKSHDTILEVNLQNLLENVNYFRSRLQPETKLMCMVKAFGYGTGGFEIAQALEAHRVDYLGVAYADEGADLRKKGIRTPIMVMNPEQSSYDTIIDHNLEAEIYSLRVLDKLTQKLIDKQVKTSFPIHIKLNTGMNRLGFKPKEISELIQRLADNPYVSVKSIFSHLATSDNMADQSFVHQQFSVYNEMYERISFNLGYQPLRHILNTSGILNFPEYQMDMVRLGIGMYGVASNEVHKKHLKTVVTFKTVISQITELEPGESVSYGRTFQAEKPIKLATLPVGYADGIKRSQSNMGEVSIHGKTAKIVGTVCMDMIMVDVSHINCQEGDEVIIFGENPDLESVAEKCNTISYEILTSVSSRVKRVYLRE
ncbi:MAG: bifunctional UDP-N-acetylmuramoyl-tripeptide:D-alanyl-D-alanine ligase/alanine racemase [Flavobacteriaceae bacterium]|nr:bifunctional UDP-N-acetylmuramoyl-tripeptide:D-alanyl-D-alanine ligase/alanine racemase [Flavobacteriaceae bacterium]